MADSTVEVRLTISVVEKLTNAFDCSITEEFGIRLTGVRVSGRIVGESVEIDARLIGCVDLAEGKGIGVSPAAILTSRSA